MEGCGIERAVCVCVPRRRIFYVFSSLSDESDKPCIVLSPPAHKLLRVNMMLEYEVHLICLSGFAKLLAILIQSWQEMH